jgi:hypothetical protein
MVMGHRVRPVSSWNCGDTVTVSELSALSLDVASTTGV